MIAKRGDDKKWEYKIFNVQMNDELAALRRETFLKTISNENAEELLNQLHVEFEKEDQMLEASWHSIHPAVGLSDSSN